ncbi:MAG: DNA replication and repair protein RecF [Nannocystaceae bacterium]|nr:DNA replication and repair protein RecF [Nannocystaceae bacterium]
MQLERIGLRDYRNFESASIEFAERFTILHGHNGAGKTAVLEAVYFLNTLRSFRSSDMGPLVRTGSTAAMIDATVQDPVAGLPSKLEVRLEKREKSTRRTASADGKVVRSGAQFYGRVRAILFTPEDLAVLRGSPSGRRQFLDRMVFARDRAHIADIQTYEKLVRSRNQVLKQDGLAGPARNDLLDTYETGLSEVGARVWTRRAEMVESLSGPFAAAFAGIHGSIGSAPGGGEAMHASAHYVSKVEADPDAREAALRAALLERRNEDLRRRVTTVGPHRDDLDVRLDDHAAADFASQGQARALVLAFKLAELRAAREKSGQPPLLLLDDVSSELDPTRTAMLFETLAQDAGQCVMTTTDAAFIRLPTGSNAATWRIDKGTATLEA